MAEESVGQTAEGDKKIVHTYPLVKVTKNGSNSDNNNNNVHSKQCKLERRISE